MKANQIRLWIVCGWTVAAMTSSATERPLASKSTNSLSGTAQGLAKPKAQVWLDGVGAGFQPTTQSLSLSAGASGGLPILGGVQHHDLALATISYGHMLGSVVGAQSWYRGNWELRAELLTGEQFYPDLDWVVGIAPHVRYHFATGTSLVPFADIGLGVSVTEIGPPDLGGTFEFNLQATVGAHWFIRDTLALTVEARYLHMSCAGLSTPNLGLNTIVGTLGVSWFF